MTRGKKVRLNAKGIRIHTSAGGAPARCHPVDWSARVGTIVRITRQKDAVVHWEGNKVPSDALPVCVLEEVA